MQLIHHDAVTGCPWLVVVVVDAAAATENLEAERDLAQSSCRD
jgi:hypothetical protein